MNEYERDFVRYKQGGNDKIKALLSISVGKSYNIREYILETCAAEAPPTFDPEVRLG